MLRRRHSINPPLNIYKKIALSFIVLTLILVGVIFYFTLSYVYLTIYPKPLEIKTDFNFVITANEKAVSQKDGIFLGQVVNQEVEGQKTFPSTGSKVLTGDVVGQVKLINDLSKSQILIATTRLLSPDNTLFRLKQRVEIPAKGSLDAAIYPDDPAKSEAKAGTIFTIPGLSKSMQLLVYGEAIQEIKPNGQTVKAVTQEDLDKAVASYTDELALQSIKNENSSQTYVLSKQISAKEFSNKAGDQVESFTLKLKLNIVGVIFDSQPVKDFAKNILESQVPPGKQLISDNTDQLASEIVKTDLANKTVQLKSSVSGNIVISETSQILDKSKLMSMSVENIKSYLKNFDEIDSVNIEFVPGWVKKMPYFQDHLIIKIAQ